MAWEQFDNGWRLAPAAGPATSLVVLLHGVGSNAHSFEPLLQEIPSSIEAIAWNAPGYGQSAFRRGQE